jgi:hypothetical protein
VLADTQSSGLFSGYSIATVSEVDNLLQSAGIPGNGVYPASMASIQSFVSMLGPSGTINGYPAVMGTTSTTNISEEQRTVTAYIFGYNGVPAYQVTDNDGDSGDLSLPVMGAWLVTPVPEPGAFPISIVGIIAFAFTQHIRSRRFNRNT